MKRSVHVLISFSSAVAGRDFGGSVRARRRSIRVLEGEPGRVERLI
jgi:hypothetical protein